MPAVSRPKQIDIKMERASQALARTEYFEAERHAADALRLAHQAQDWARMARILLPLQEARRQRLQLALDLGRITIVDRPPAEDATVEPGCYLVQPPLVGADARRLRLSALERDVPVAVVCREPLTQIRLCPIVAIASGVTVRTKIDPPADPADPDLAWFAAALEELGDFAIESLDPGLALTRRIDALVQRLDAIPEHERLHQALAEACRQADRERPEETERARRKGR